MKFGHDFSQSLEGGDFPHEWIDSAISYKELKKCIKKVQKQIQSLGLDVRTLEDLWEAIESQQKVDGDVRPKIDPKFVLALDPETGAPRDAWLTEDTRRSLRKLVVDKHSKTHETPQSQQDEEISPVSTNASSDIEEDGVGDTISSKTNVGVTLQEVEVPLISNSEFFRILKKEVSDLGDLQDAEQRKVEAQINQLGQELTTMVEAGTKRSKTDVVAWREIFGLYVDSQIFFSNKEKDRGARNSSVAAKQLELYTTTVKHDGRIGKLTKEGLAAYDRFIRINTSLLHYLRFQELNQTALSKILKKFDKRTALHAQAMMAARLADRPFITQSLARAACFKISEDLVTIIPQLNDYLCPICFNVSFKPIRLRCDHVFCIRCLIVMQRAKQNHCPLCREGSVMEASSDNMDVELLEFLKLNFPKEVKTKQKDNERAAGVDRYGDDFDKTRCVVM